jgi:hypothetical protein
MKVGGDVIVNAFRTSISSRSSKNGEEVVTREMLWKDACKIYKLFFTAGAKSQFELENPEAFDVLHPIFHSMVWDLGKPPKTKEYVKILLEIHNLLYNDIRMDVFDQFMHSKSVFHEF